MKPFSMRSLIAVLMTLALAWPMAAQQLAFTASSDHDDDTLLTGYRVQAVDEGTGGVVASAEIGKPTYDPIREIRVAFSALPNPYQANGTYHLEVAALGPGGPSALVQAQPPFIYCPAPPPPPGNLPPTVSLTAPPSGSAYTAPATIPLTANAADPDGTIARVDFLAGGTVIGSDASSPYAFTWNNVGAGPVSLTAVAIDNAGASTTSAAVAVTVANPPGGALPAPWVSVDLGSPSPAGSATFANGTFTVKGSGADIWGTSDQFHFAYQPMTGDGQIIARVTSVTATNAWTKAGVMIRASLTANAAYSYALVSASSGVEHQYRTATNASASRISGPFLGAPYWVRVVRTGNLFTAYSSANGTTWTSMGSQTITMGSTVYVGLAVTSHASGSLATATFTDVTR